MNVELKLNIVGLGIGRILWTRLSGLISSLLEAEGIRAQFGYYNRAGLSGYRKYLEKLGQGDADIIITSFSFYSNLQLLEQLANENSALSTAGPPRILFLENNIRRFLVNLLENQPSVRFDFQKFGELHAQDLDLFAMPGETPIRVEVSPNPEVRSFSEDRMLFIGGKNAAFCRLNAVKEVSWQDKRYTAEDFIDAVLLKYPGNVNRKYAKLLQREGDSVFITNGLSLDELNTISFNYMQIDHVLTIDQLKKRSAAFDRFLVKFREIAKSRCCRIFGSSVREDELRVKSTVPITVCSDYPVINDIYRHVLVDDGYQRVQTGETVSNLSDSLQLNLSESSEEHSKSVLNHHLLLEREIFNIAGFPKVTRKQSTRPPVVNGYEQIEEIKVERSQIIRKLKKLEEQIRNLSGSKILADQERYMNMLAGRKLEILTVLMEMADVWDENDEEPKRTYEENVLVFHDDPLQASTINNRLQGDGKRLFVDVTRKFGTLKDFVTLNTDILEPFLHEGFIYCYAASKSISERKLKGFQNELTDKKYPEIAKGIENLKTERSRLQKKLLDLAYLEAFELVRHAYQDQSEMVYSSAKRACRFFETRRFSASGLKSFCLYSTDEERCRPVQRAISQALGGAKGTRFDRVLLPLNLTTDVSAEESAGLQEMAGSETTRDALVQEAVIQNNVKLLSSYLNKTVKEFHLVSSDLLVMIQDLDMIALLVRMMRESGGHASKVPLLAVFHGALKADRINELLNNGVLPVYYDSLFSTRDTDMLDQLRAVFE